MFLNTYDAAIQEDLMLVPKGAPLLLDMTDALCEAKCVKVMPMIFLFVA